MTEVFLEDSGQIITLNKNFNYHKLHPGDYIVLRDEKDSSKIYYYKLICFIHFTNKTLPVINRIKFGGFMHYSEKYMKYIENLK